MSSSENLPMDQPLGLCDVVGLAVRIWRKNLGLILRALMMPTIMLAISTSVLQFCLQYGFSGFSDFPRTVAFIGAAFAAFLLYIFALFYLAVQEIALVRLFTGFAPDWEKARAFSMKRLPWVIGLSFINLMIWGVILAIFFCIIGISTFSMSLPGAGPVLGTVGMIVGFFGIIVTISVMLLYMLMGFAVIACEETTFFGVIGRTFNWVGRYFGRTLCFGFIFYTIFTAISMPVSLPVVVVSVIDAMQAGAHATAGAEPKLSMPVLMFVQVWESICGLLLRPLTVLSFGLYYLDLRQRADGLDLFRKLRVMKEQFASVGENGLQGR